MTCLFLTLGMGVVVGSGGSGVSLVSGLPSTVVDAYKITHEINYFELKN